MIEGLETADLKILDPLNEHRNDYIWLRFQACYPEIYKHVTNITRTSFNNMFLISCTMDDGLNADKLFMFDYDSGDIIGLVGTIDMYSDVFHLIDNLPRGFYFVNNEGHHRHVVNDKIKEELIGNTIGVLILQIINMIDSTRQNIQ